MGEKRNINSVFVLRKYKFYLVFLISAVFFCANLFASQEGDVIASQEGDVVVIPDEPIFILENYKSGQSGVRLEYSKIKASINKKLNEYNINLYRDNYKLRIVGHTDSTGKENRNVDLGRKRAIRFAKLLENDFGAENLYVGTQADYVLITENEKNRNRRVEVWLYKIEDYRDKEAEITIVANHNSIKYFEMGDDEVKPIDFDKPILVIDNYEVSDDTIRIPYPKVKTILTRELEKMSINLYRDGYKLRIVGHTDSTGKEKTNIEMGKRRANQVAAMLKKDFGTQNIYVGTMADYIAVETNTNASGRAYNRRIEIWLDKSEDFRGNTGEWEVSENEGREPPTQIKSKVQQKTKSKIKKKKTKKFANKKKKIARKKNV
ncbi:MAG: hypothetical protein Ta2D_00760 [Rickettsiales bacterium]|nr:MAG: hypothetical protein Ta2D_00760 [Rickettsiales bacterium]